MKVEDAKGKRGTVLYATNINTLTASEYNESLDNIISSRAKEKIGNFKFISDRKRSLCGELLVRYMIANKDIVLDVDSNGKPYCKNFPEIHFNISHSGDWVICAICDSPIGVDIEKIGHADLQIAKRFFTEYEYRQLLNQETNRSELFYKLWTLKEKCRETAYEKIKKAVSELHDIVRYANIFCKQNFGNRTCDAEMKREIETYYRVYEEELNYIVTYQQKYIVLSRVLKEYGAVLDIALLEEVNCYLKFFNDKLQNDYWDRLIDFISYFLVKLVKQFNEMDSRKKRIDEILQQRF